MAASKLVKACKAMKDYGISAKEVKAVLKDLLPLYQRNWTIIEGEHYKVLLDAIFTRREDSKKEEMEEQPFCLRDESEEGEEEEEECEQPLKKSRLRKQTSCSPSSSGDDSSPHFNTGSSFPNQYAEEDIQMNTVSAPNDFQSRGNRPQTSLADEETEASQEFSTDVQCNCDILSPEKPSVSPQVFQRKQRSTPERGGDDVLSSKLDTELGRGHNGKACAVTAVELPQYEVPLAVIHPGNYSDTEAICLESPKIIHLDAEGIYHPNSSGDHGKHSTAKTNRLKFPDIIDLDAYDESPSEGLCENGSSAKKLSGFEGNSLEVLGSKQANTEGNGSDASRSSKIEIASSLKGEVRISFIYDVSQQRKFQIPSLDAVLKRVEDKYCKSFGTKNTGFTLSKLLKEMCERFLEHGTISMDAEQAPSTLDSMKCFKQDVTSIKSNVTVPHQDLSLCLPQIPRLLSSNRLELEYPHRVKGLNFNGKCFGHRFTNTMKFNFQEAATSNKLAIVLMHEPPAELKNDAYYIFDIARGTENSSISVVNDFNKEKQPAFTYIPRNITYCSAYVKFLLARISDENCCSNCIGDCTSLDIPCACAGETGGEFAYTPEGLIKEKFLESCVSIKQNPQPKNYIYCVDCPLERSKEATVSGSCKGHLVRKFIKECWYKCGCDLKCGNRVVQRGIAANLQVFMTPEGKGWGLKTLENLPKGAFVCEYVGEIVTNTELYNRNMSNTNDRHTYPVLLDADWSSEGVLKDEEALCLDATSIGNVARFINHRCVDANMVEIPVEIETPDHHYYHVAFFTTREVKAFEELTWDYSIDFTDNGHPVKAFKCKCGSPHCMNMKRRKRTRT